MKFIIILLLLFSQLSAQKLICTNLRKSPEIFIPSYPFHFELEDSNDCKDYTYECKNASIRPTGDCKFQINFSMPGPYLIEVKDTDGNTITIKDGLVRNYPKPRAGFARKVEGAVQRGEFRAQQGIFAMGHFSRHIITGFQYAIHRENELLHTGSQNTARFGTKIKDEIDNMKLGDSIYFYDITVVLPGDIYETTLNTISITMK